MRIGWFGSDEKCVSGLELGKEVDHVKRPLAGCLRFADV